MCLNKLEEQEEQASDKDSRVHNTIGVAHALYHYSASDDHWLQNKYQQIIVSFTCFNEDDLSKKNNPVTIDALRVNEVVIFAIPKFSSI